MKYKRQHYVRKLVNSDIQKGSVNHAVAFLVFELAESCWWTWILNTDEISVRWRKEEEEDKEQGTTAESEAMESVLSKNKQCSRWRNSTTGKISTGSECREKLRGQRWQNGSIWVTRAILHTLLGLRTLKKLPVNENTTAVRNSVHVCSHFLD